MEYHKTCKLRHGWRYIKSTLPHMSRTQARAQHYRDMNAMPKLSAVKNRAYWETRRSLQLSHKQTIMMRHRVEATGEAS